jgi:membrane protein implicated in regulation of membrane protease activity
MDAYQITFLVALALAMVELVTGAFLFLGMALGAAAVACVQWATAGFALNRDLLIFAIVSVLAFLVLRKLFARPADQEESPDDVNRY